MDIELALDTLSITEAFIKRYFNWTELWAHYPIDAMLDEKWFIVGDEFNGGQLTYFEPVCEIADLDDLDDECIEDSRYTAVIKSPVARKGDYVMVAIDTECDGNRYLAVLRADNELKEKTEP